MSEALEGVLMAEAAVAALRLASARRGHSKPLSTFDILLALEATDTTGAWSRFLIDERPRDDPTPRSSSTWDGVPLTGESAVALAWARRLGEAYDLAPLPVGALALALVVDPESAAARAFVGITHKQLLDDVQDDLLGAQLRGLEDLYEAEPLNLDAPRTRPLSADRPGNRGLGIVVSGANAPQDDDAEREGGVRRQDDIHVPQGVWVILGKVALQGLLIAVALAAFYLLAVGLISGVSHLLDSASHHLYSFPGIQSLDDIVTHFLSKAIAKIGASNVGDIVLRVGLGVGLIWVMVISAGSVRSCLVGVLCLGIPLGLIVGSAYWLQTPRSFNSHAAACGTATEALPTSAELRVTSVERSPETELAFTPPVGETSSPQLYWSVRCLAEQTFEGQDYRGVMTVLDMGSGAAARATLTKTSDDVPLRSDAPGEIPSLRGAILADGSINTVYQFVTGRLIVRIASAFTSTRDVPISAAVARSKQVTLALAGATVVTAPSAPDIAKGQLFRDHYATVWAWWLVALALIPLLVALVFSDEALSQLLIRTLTVMLSLRSRGARAEQRTPSCATVIRMTSRRLRARRWARLAWRLFVAAAWGAGVWLLVRGLPAGIPAWQIALLAGGLYGLVELVRQRVIALIPAYHYLRSSSGRGWTRAGVAVLFDAVFAAIVVYLASHLAQAWMSLPLDGTGAGEIVLFIMFGPLVFVLVSSGLSLVRRILTVWTADELAESDTRPNQIVYLRSFRDDNLRMPARISIFDPLSSVFDLVPERDFEVILARRLARYGRVTAVGRPGEGLRPLGAARSYLPSDAWQDTVTEMVRSSRNVVMTMGTTPSLSWEMGTIRELGALPKTVVLIPPTADADDRVHLLFSLLHAKVPPTHGDELLSIAAVGFGQDGGLRLVYADVRDDVAYEAALAALLNGPLAVPASDP